MKRLFPFLILFLSTGLVFSQISHDGTPLSFALDTEEKPRFNQIATPDVEQLTANEDPADFRREIGSMVPVEFQWEDWKATSGPNGELIARLAIEAPGAKAVGLYFDVFKIPEGGKLFVYDEQGNQLKGSYTYENNKPGDGFAIEMVLGDKLILEYNAPKDMEALPIFDFEGIGFLYRDVPQKNTQDFGNSESCQVNVNCPEGVGWQEQRNSVVRILIYDQGSNFWCSGTLMNTVNGSGEPYVLLADHCAMSSNSSDFDKFIFYFNYQSPTCNNPGSDSGLASQTITGSMVKARAGSNKSDFLLVLLEDTVPESYSPYFAGWSVENSATVNGVAIHHPSGDIKKISSFTTQPQSDSYEGIVSGTHWQVNWSGSANGHGVTEPGSSGGPLFDNNGLVIGTLTGGSSTCSNKDAPDYYGKMWYHWDQVGSAADERLDFWLDPEDSGVLSIGGGSRPLKVDTLNNSVGERSSRDELKIYPNPSMDGEITLKFAGQPSSISIYDLTGKQIQHHGNINDHSFQITLPRGYYVARVQGREKVHTRKITVVQ